MSSLFQQLQTQFQQLQQMIVDAGIKPHQWFGNSDLFNSSCFYCQSDEVRDYLKELENNIKRLEQISEAGYSEFLTERITQQFVCLKALVNARSVNSKNQSYKRDKQKKLAQIKHFANKATKSSQDLYSELSELQQFERRLLDMVNEKQMQLNAYTGSKNRQELQQQVLLTQQRLGRCRQALSKVEEQIQRLDEHV